MVSRDRRSRSIGVAKGFDPCVDTVAKVWVNQPCGEFLSENDDNHYSTASPTRIVGGVSEHHFVECELSVQYFHTSNLAGVAI